MRRIWGNSSVTTDIIGVGMNMQRITLMQISRTLAAAGILFVTSVAALAQPPAGAPGRGGGRGGPPAPKSPEVSADSRVTFRLRAPNAKEVAVTGMAGGRLVMQKDEQGVWSITTDALKPDMYSYSFSIDGATVTNVTSGLGELANLDAAHQKLLSDPALTRARHAFLRSPVSAKLGMLSSVKWSDPAGSP